MGSQLVSTNQGILTDRLGELGLLLACRAVLGQPIAASRKRCCHNLPIEIDNQVKYVTPVTRILTDNCDQTQCSRSYPIIFTISENISLCQFPDEIEICASPTFLDPATRLIPAKFVTLSDSENRIGNSFRWDQDIKSLIDNMLTDSMAQSSIFNTIAYNSRVCKNQDIFCPEGREIKGSFKRELGRASQSIFSYILNHTNIGLIIQWTVIVWSIYSILSGMVNFIVRIRNLIPLSGERNMSCCSILLTLFSLLDSSFNPLNMVNSEMRSNILTLRAQVNDLTEYSDTMEKKLTKLVSRTVQLEEELEHWISTRKAATPPSLGGRSMLKVRNSFMRQHDKDVTGSNEVEIQPKWLDKYHPFDEIPEPCDHNGTMNGIPTCEQCNSIIYLENMTKSGACDKQNTEAFPPPPRETDNLLTSTIRRSRIRMSSLTEE